MAEPARLRDHWVDREVPDAVIIVPLCDRWAIETLGLSVEVVACDGGVFLWRGAPLAPDLVYGAAICALVLSAEGAGKVGDLAASWGDTFGTDLPETIDLSGVAADRWRETALARLCEIVLSERGDAARRMVSVLRALAVLRQEHEAMQAAFARLEAHAALHRLSQRKLSFAMARVDGSPALVLPSGAGVVQRVPGGSVGLSDLAVRIAELPARKGVLRCRLDSPDWGGTVAQWTVPAERIEAGWLRLSLVAGLDADPVGLDLRLDWEGASPLRLETAMAHPDARFRPLRLGGGEAGRHVLAMEVWHYLPGVRAPASAKGVLPDDAGGVEAPTLRLELAELLRAINLETLVQDMHGVDGGQALLVHVMPERVACAILPEAVAGMRLVSADVMTWNAKGPLVDYAIGVLPVGLRPRRPGVLPEFPEGHHSGWVRMKPMRAGQVSLILPDLPGDGHDLYLMTRLPPGVTSNAWGWSGFSAVVMHV